MAYPFRPTYENNLRLFLEVSKKYFSSQEIDCSDKNIIPPADKSRLENQNSALINQEVANTPIK